MKKLIGISLSLMLLATTNLNAKNVISVVKGKTRVNPDTRVVTCPGDVGTCATLYDDHTADININGDTFPGHWYNVVPNPPAPQNPLPIGSIPAELDDNYSVDMDCPTCPVTTP